MPAVAGPEVTILDVGHGNCAIIRQDDRCVIVDAPPGATLFDELERCGIRTIDHLVLSHSDLDHMGGAAKLLWDTRFNIGTLWYNSDGTKQTKAWKGLATQARLRFEAGGLDGQRNLNSASSKDLTFSSHVSIDVLHPDLEMATLGPSERSSPMGVLTANTVSAVLLVSLEGEPAVLLAADIDAVALGRILDLSVNLRARVLVFPHHGGKAGRVISREFARSLCDAVEPDLILFSMARGGRFSNPDPEMIKGVRDSRPSARIACTQLSIHCDAQGIGARAGHLSLHASAGRSSGACCMGSLTIRKANGVLVFQPTLDDHQSFVDSVNDPLCRRQIIPLPLPRNASP